MDWLGDGARLFHVVFGFAGLAAFWIPVFAKKGAVNHVRFGRIFAWSAYVVLGSAGLALTVRFIGLGMDAVGPTEQPLLYGFLVFLAYLTFVTFVTVRHGVGVLRNKVHRAVVSRRDRRHHDVVDARALGELRALVLADQARAGQGIKAGVLSLQNDDAVKTSSPHLYGIPSNTSARRTFLTPNAKSVRV